MASSGRTSSGSDERNGPDKAKWNGFAGIGGITQHSPRGAETPSRKRSCRKRVGCSVGPATTRNRIEACRCSESKATWRVNDSGRNNSALDKRGPWWAAILVPIAVALIAALLSDIRISKSLPATSSSQRQRHRRKRCRPPRSPRLPPAKYQSQQRRKRHRRLN